MCYSLGSSGISGGKESACSAADLGLTSGLGRSPGEGNGNPLQYSCLENSMDRGTWQATYSPWGCKESDTTEQLSTFFNPFKKKKKKTHEAQVMKFFDELNHIKLRIAVLCVWYLTIMQRMKMQAAILKKKIASHKTFSWKQLKIFINQ